jgi:hypothetical protein
MHGLKRSTAFLHQLSLIKDMTKGRFPLAKINLATQNNFTPHLNFFLIGLTMRDQSA